MTVTFQPYRLPSVFGCAVSLAIALSFGTGTAHAKTLPGLSEQCFVYNPGHENGTEHHLSSTGFSAELPGTGISVTVGTLHLTDQNGKLDPEALSRINAAATYGLLSAALHGLSPHCAGQPLPETDEIKGSRPDAQWTHITLTQPDDTPLSFETVHLSLPNTTPDIHVLIKATGVHKANQALVPSSFNGDLTFQPSATPPYHITIHGIKATFGKSIVSGTGSILVASNLEDSTGSIHLSITNIGTLITQVNKIAPPKMTMALLIARMMGHSEGQNTTGWTIRLKKAKVHVNGVNMPLGLH